MFFDFYWNLQACGGVKFSHGRTWLVVSTWFNLMDLKLASQRIGWSTWIILDYPTKKRAYPIYYGLYMWLLTSYFLRRMILQDPPSRPMDSQFPSDAFCVFSVNAITRNMIPIERDCFSRRNEKSPISPRNDWVIVGVYLCVCCPPLIFAGASRRHLNLWCVSVMFIPHCWVTQQAPTLSS